ncbi:MAG TPA: DUF983 domain-containing protein [Gemmatimonadaceae bacterium]
MPRLRERTTDSPLQLPSGADALRLVGRVLRLRCPHCGEAPVMKWSGAVLRRCGHCNFRFERSDENYFSGAMFFGLLMGEFFFAIVLLITVVSMWPDVPWDTMTWAVPLGVLLVMVFIIPVSRVVWLAIDILVRPVQPSELID